MSAVQLEFKLYNDNKYDALEYECVMTAMQSQIDLLETSMAKVRRKLFGRIGELEALCLDMQKENTELRHMIKSLLPSKSLPLHAKPNQLDSLPPKNEILTLIA